MKNLSQRVRENIYMLEDEGWKVGDRICFDHGTKVLEGIIISAGPKYSYARTDLIDIKHYLD